MIKDIPEIINEIDELLNKLEWVRKQVAEVEREYSEWLKKENNKPDETDETTLDPDETDDFKKRLEAALKILKGDN